MGELRDYETRQVLLIRLLDRLGLGLCRQSPRHLDGSGTILKHLGAEASLVRLPDGSREITALVSARGITLLLVSHDRCDAEELWCARCECFKNLVVSPLTRRQPASSR